MMSGYHSNTSRISMPPGLQLAEPMYAGLGYETVDAFSMRPGYSNWPAPRPSFEQQEQNPAYDRWNDNAKAFSQTAAFPHYLLPVDGPRSLSHFDLQHSLQCASHLSSTQDTDVKPSLSNIPLPFGIRQQKTGSASVEGYGSNESTDSGGDNWRRDIEDGALDEVSTDSGSEAKSRLIATESSKGKQKSKSAPVAQPGQVDASITTWMICNIPCCVTQESLVQSIDSLGFDHTYDYLYLPTPNHNGSSQNLGYGFINFKDAVHGVRFRDAFQNFQFEETQSTKFCEVRPARIQGLASNIRHLKRSMKKPMQGQTGQHILEARSFA